MFNAHQFLTPFFAQTLCSIIHYRQHPTHNCIFSQKYFSLTYSLLHYIVLFFQLILYCFTFKKCLRSPTKELVTKVISSLLKQAILVAADAPFGGLGICSNCRRTRTRSNTESIAILGSANRSSTPSVSQAKVERENI